MSAARCDVTELLVDECAHCTGATLDTPVGPAERTMFACWSTRCPECHRPIVEDETRIGLVDGRWLCCYTEAAR